MSSTINAKRLRASLQEVIARDIFFRYRDKSYSFTDCTSFVVMRELKLKDALTTDRHFRQMGFNIVPGLRARV